MNPSEPVLEEKLSPIKILTFTGSSGVGKTTLVDALMKAHPEFERVISCTTRPRRSSDPDGEYAYLNNTEFKERIRKNEFLWHGEYASAHYGTLKISIDEALESHDLRIMTLTPDKTTLLKALHPTHVLSFLIIAPSDEVIRKRLLGRGDSEEEIQRRVSSNRAWGQKHAGTNVPYIHIANSGTIQESLDKILRALP